METRQRLIELITNISVSTGLTYECKVEVEFEHYFDPTINHEKQTNILQNIVKETLGDHMLNPIEGLPVMASEDFSFYLNQIPGCFFFLNNIIPG